MFEIRFHGRGGPETALAAKMLVDAAARSGRGVRVSAYARAEGEALPARREAPDAVVVLDPALASDPGVASGLRPGGSIVVNSTLSAEELSARWPGLHVFAVPARRIAASHGLAVGPRPPVDAAMCGAVCALFELADAFSLEDTIRDAVPVEPGANAAAAWEAFVLCREEAVRAPA
jgi:Pyruvate/2-oxoacid:ferredoxin oxidoreductase gamma subunit